MTYDEAVRAMQAGATVSSAQWTYRMTDGRLERLNGWWQIAGWPSGDGFEWMTAQYEHPDRGLQRLDVYDVRSTCRVAARLPGRRGRARPPGAGGGERDLAGWLNDLT